MPGGRVYPVDDATIYFVSSISAISSYVNSILKTISSRSLYSAFFNSFYISFFEYQDMLKRNLELASNPFSQLLSRVVEDHFEIQALIIFVVSSL